MVIVCGLLQLYVPLIVLRVVMSWFPVSPNGTLETVAGFLYMLTDPVLRPLRRLLPPVRMGAMALDPSPIVAFFGLSVLRGILCG